MSSETNLEQVSALTLITPIKQGFIPEFPILRYVEKLKIILAGLQERIAARQFSVLDQINTIHFARWVIIDNDQKLLFTSNFDGSLTSYLQDFTNNAELARWLDEIWGLCEEYPGARPEAFQRFEAWVKKYAVNTTTFYAATPDLTVKDVKWLRAFKARYDRLIQRVQEQPEQLTSEFQQFQRDVLTLGRRLALQPTSDAEAPQPTAPEMEGPVTFSEPEEPPRATAQLARNLQDLAFRFEEALETTLKDEAEMLRLVSHLETHPSHKKSTL